MNERDWTRTRLEDAEELARGVDLSDDARALLEPGLAPRAFFEALVERELVTDAVRFLASALPHREAVAWACACVAPRLGVDAGERDREALRLAREWVHAPGEEAGRAAFVLAQELEFRSAASWAATAAFWSGPSLSPPDVPAVPPAPELTGKAACGAVLLAAVEEDAARMDDNLRAFLELGVELARGQTPWDVRVPGAEREEEAARWSSPQRA